MWYVNHLCHSHALAAWERTTLAHPNAQLLMLIREEVLRTYEYVNCALAADLAVNDSAIDGALLGHEAARHEEPRLAVVDHAVQNAVGSRRNVQGAVN